MKHLSTACWDDKGGVGVFFDASKQYTCLQSPWPPFAKYISHIPVAPFNTESAKRDLNRFSSPKLGQGSLENYLGFVGGGERQYLYCHFYRYPVLYRCGCACEQLFLLVEQPS